MAPAELRRLLLDDRTATVDRRGKLYYRDPVRTGAEQTDAAVAPYPLDQTFRLNSLPGSQHTLFIDFDGAVVENTFWNADNGVAGGISPRLDRRRRRQHLQRRRAPADPGHLAAGRRGLRALRRQRHHRGPRRRRDRPQRGGGPDLRHPCAGHARRPGRQRDLRRALCRASPTWTSSRTARTTASSSPPGSSRSSTPPAPAPAPRASRRRSATRSGTTSRSNHDGDATDGVLPGARVVGPDHGQLRPEADHPVEQR